MGERFGALREWGIRANNRWKEFSLNQKVLIGGATLLLLIAVVMWIVGANRTQWSPLYTDLSTSDAAAIRAKLADMKVPYQIAGNGTEILVPEQQKYDVRLQLASDGLPQGPAGFELFNNSSFGETETDKKVKYQEALQGEITRTILSLNKVQAARVNLTLPEQSLFESKDTPPTAAVMIKCKPGEQLTDKEVNGIIHLVANSVERLTPENVFVVDDQGNPISVGVLSGTASDSNQLTVEQLQIKRQFELQKEMAIQSMLDATLGPGHAVVRVSADLNFDKIESMQENYDPNQRVIVSEHKVTESTTSTSSAAQGVPGVGSNVPQYQTTNIPTTQTSDKSDITRNYEGDKTQTKTEVAPGSVKKLTVGVLLDKKYANQMQAISDAVTSAAGAQVVPIPPATTPRDTVTVSVIPFAQTAPQATKPGLAETLRQYWWVWLLALLLAGLVIVLARRRRQAGEEAGLEPLFDATAGEDLTLEQIMEKSLTPEEKERQRIKEEIDKLIDKSPEDAAQVIRTWLLEDMR